MNLILDKLTVDDISMLKRRKIIIIILCLVALMVIWKAMRATSSVPYEWEMETASDIYKQNDKVMNTVSLSYFVYGCENVEEKSEKVSDILDNNELGIVTENFGLKRSDENDPTTAMINTSEFIKKHVGDYRFLTDLQDKGSGFYGAAFCDDEHKCIWIPYSGSVTFKDAVA